MEGNQAEITITLLDIHLQEKFIGENGHLNLCQILIHIIPNL